MVSPAKLQRQLEAYLQQHCPEALRAGERGRRSMALPLLTAVDKALIYHYSEDGFESLNAGLHASGGQNESLFGTGLANALSKLPPYVGEANSGIYLSPTQLQHYRTCVQSGEAVQWPAFLSASEKPSIAMKHLRTPEKNCLFVIQSYTGRLIQEAAKWGVDGQNEFEVLFMPNTQFAVLQIVDEPDYTRIVLDEL